MHNQESQVEYGNSGKSELEINSPIFHCPDASSSIWANIKSNSDQEIKKYKGLIEPFSEYPYNIISGTVNLINYILKRYSVDPVKTIVFLDKSSRPAAHVFRILWKELVDAGKEEGTIDQMIDCPTIKFLDPGHSGESKNSSVFSKKSFKSRFSESDFEDGGVLIVDDVIASGGSVNNAINLLQDSFGISADAMSQFEVLPRWFSEDHLKTIKDYNGHEKMHQFMDLLDENTQLFLVAISNGSNTFPNLKFLFDKLNDENFNQLEFYELFFDLFIKLGISKNKSFTVFIEVITIFSNYNFMEIVDFLKSSGGFISLRNDNRIISRQSLLFRKYLTSMAIQAADHITLS